MKFRAWILIAACSLLLGCSATPTGSETMQMDLPAYRVYISNLNRAVKFADAESFANGEQERLVSISDQILATVGEVAEFTALSHEDQLSLVTWNDELHVLMLGYNDSLSEGRICRTDVSTGSNIRTRSCRTRAQLTQERQLARSLLMNRGDDVDRLFLDDQTRPVTGFGTANLGSPSLD